MVRSMKGILVAKRSCGATDIGCVPLSYDAGFASEGRRWIRPAVSLSITGGQQHSLPDERNWQLRQGGVSKRASVVRRGVRAAIRLEERLEGDGA